MEIKVHPLAEIFPLLDDKALQDLADDIKQNGQQTPILACRGTIVDGRNRLKACEIAGVEPLFLIQDDMSEEQIRSFIVSANLHRRHLTTQQRAHIAAEFAKGTWGGSRSKVSNDTLPKPLTIKEAAQALNVSEASVKRAANIKRTDPEAHQAAMRGERQTRLRRVGGHKPATTDALKAVISTAIINWMAEHPDTTLAMVGDALSGAWEAIKVSETQEAA